MSTSTSIRNSASAAPCGCAGGSTGKALAAPCECGGGCASCQTTSYVRPRFFAGQLLTEEDLQALSDYVIEKNRLHNRDLFGDGVVCGLQVSCGPCGSAKLVVQPGHALDCCGNDLVLECAVELDAIAMVRELRQKLRGGADCGDPCSERKPNGDKLEPSQKNEIARHYCLYVRYHEQSSDPVAPYATDEPCAATGCKFTRVREGVRFELRCREETGPKDGFLYRARLCLLDLSRAEVLSAALAKLFDTANPPTPEDVAAAREALLDQLDATPQLTDCRLRADVAAIAVPPSGVPVDDAREQLVIAYVRLLRDCICRALLPPCSPCDDAAVLLACFTLLDCELTDICNLERKFVLTGPNLRYWLPLDLMGDLFETLCCTDLQIDLGQGKAAPAQPAPAVPAAAMAASPVNASAASAAAKSPKVGKAPAAPTRSDKGDEDESTMLRLLGEHLRQAFGLSEGNVTQLEHIAGNLQKVFDGRGFDELLPMRALRRTTRFDTIGAALSGPVDSAEIHKSMRAMAKENRDLHARLGGLLERVDKLEAGSAPPANPDIKKTPGK